MNTIQLEHVTLTAADRETAKRALLALEQAPGRDKLKALLIHLITNQTGQVVPLAAIFKG